MVQIECNLVATTTLRLPVKNAKVSLAVCNPEMLIVDLLSGLCLMTLGKFHTGKPLSLSSILWWQVQPRSYTPSPAIEWPHNQNFRL